MANEHHFNAHPHPKPEEAAAHAKAAAGRVWVSQNAASAPITQVKQSTFNSNNLYWLNVSGAGAINNAEFVVKFKAGSPLQNQDQTFQLGGGYSGGISTPFGVPFWGGDPILGPATLTVSINGAPVGSYNFTVIA